MRFLNIRIAHHRVLLWITAFVITVGSAVYQRLTGPTYPLRGKAAINESTVSFRFLRSETTDRDARVAFTSTDTVVEGFVRYRRYKSNDEWSVRPMERRGDSLVTYLPCQPPAGKLIYFVYAVRGDEEISLTKEMPVILRYKGAVPGAILILHVLVIFSAMLLSNRTLLESFDEKGNARKLMLWTIAFFFVGGFIFGPIMQKYAFGAIWTGVPFGHDLTDNKVLIAMLGWLFAWYKNRKGRSARGWIFFAAVLMLVVYMIPHSLLGSELDYTEMPEPQ